MSSEYTLSTVGDREPHGYSLDTPEQPSNREFLQVVFGGEWEQAHVTAFADDPSNIVSDRRALCWGGGSAGERLKGFKPGENQYYCISLFSKDESGKSRRRKALFDATFVVVADDVNEKLPVERVEKLPAPSFKLFSSAGSEQWGWVLDQPEEDRGRVENLLDGLVSQGLAPDGTDPGMKGVTRYVRLPGGSNTKASRLIEGEPFKGFLSEWHPERQHRIEDLAAVFGIDLDVVRNESESSGLAIDDPVTRNHPVFKYLTVTEAGNDGWLRVDCPNAAKHSSDDASGAAVQIQADGAVFFICHHGHCLGEKDTQGQKLTGPRMLKLLDAQLGGSGQLLDEVDDYQKSLFVESKKSLADAVGDRVPASNDNGKELADGPKPSFDPLRYVFIAPENRFFDIQTGMLIAPKALDNLYLKELPPGRNRHTASDMLLRTMDADVSAADGIGWHPTGPEAPQREDLMIHDEGKKLVNTWPGFALTPIEGDVSLWLDHAAYLFPDADEREVVLDYLACLVQRLDEKPAFFLAHRGAHRVGKDLFYKPLVVAMGSRSAKTINIDDILAGWGDYLQGVKFVIVTEVDKAQDRKVSNGMKTVAAPTASGKRTLNLKGGRVITQVDSMGGVMMSNERAFMTIEKGDRRYFVADSWIEPKEPGHYAAIDRWLREENGPAKVLHYLLHRDISGFNHMQLPYLTAGALEMVQSGKYDYEQDLEEAIHSTTPPFHREVIVVKEVKAWAKSADLKCGNNGLEAAMRRAGWTLFSRYRVRKDGAVVAVPAFFSKTLPEDAAGADVLEHFMYHTSVS